jgi:hypothetical protein
MKALIIATLITTIYGAFIFNLIEADKETSAKHHQQFERNFK